MRKACARWRAPNHALVTFDEENTNSVVPIILINGGRGDRKDGEKCEVIVAKRQENVLWNSGTEQEMNTILDDNGKGEDSDDGSSESSGTDESAIYSTKSNKVKKKQKERELQRANASALNLLEHLMHSDDEESTLPTPSQKQFKSTTTATNVSPSFYTGASGRTTAFEELMMADSTNQQVAEEAYPSSEVWKH
ncbi:hypothetical protein EMCRGX_G005934 [Ephydatia muelleri]